ncbi:MAG: hypothetical protein Kow00121_48450 [Elainellaceae cyanobacterium]
MSFRIAKKLWFTLLLVLTILAVWIYGQFQTRAIAQVEPSSAITQPTTDASSAARAPLLLGFYTSGYVGSQSVIDRELRTIDDWVGQQSSLVGMFLDIEDENPAYNVTQQLETLRDNGYTAFINLKSHRTATEIAQGTIDHQIRAIARAYVNWADQGERVAFIAPLQEMNIAGESYARDPENFKLAYQRIQTIFQEAEVPAPSVKWVFAPNGWSENEFHRFENYYPGSEKVDVVAFSGYNWGYCRNSSWVHWSTTDEVFTPYIQRMQTMAPGKPIFVAQTASTSDTANGVSDRDKNQWLQDTYAYLASIPDIQGALYFNIHKECDWTLFDDHHRYEGYRQTVTANPAFRYVDPQTIAATNF